MSAQRYGFRVSAWVEPKHYAALRADVNVAIDRAVAAERQRCAGIAELARNEWIKHTHQDDASRLVIEVLGKCAERIRTFGQTGKE